MEAVAELKKTIDEIGTAWSEYKKTNDAKIAEVEKKGVADPLLKEKLGKMDDAISKFEEQKKRLETIEVALKRFGSAGGGQMRIKDPITGEEKEAPEDWKDAKGAYSKFLRKGTNKDNSREIKEFEYDQKSLSVQSDPDGGFLVTADMSGRIVKKVFETSAIEQVASVQVIGTDALEGTYDDDEAAGGWVSEQGTRNTTATPKIGKWRIPVHELYAMPSATQRLLDDANVDVEAWLAGKIADKFQRILNAAYVTGTGAGQPRGFLTYASGTTLRTQVQQVGSGSSGAFTADALFDVVYALKADYRRNAQWAMPRLAIGAVRKLKDSQNRYLWEPSLQVGQPASLLGFGINEFNDMPSPAANSLSAAFADWKEFYQVVKRAGIRVLRDPYTVKGFVLFYTTARSGGDVLNTEAGIIHKLA